jgi:soluble lytic murein transglycosylase
VGDVVSRLVRHRTGLTRPELKSLAQTLYDEAHAHGLDPSLVLGVIEVESSYDNFAVSPVGAIGLMQILPSTGKELAGKLEVPWEGPQTLFDPQVNLRLGVAYLAQMRQRYGNLSTALAAYNCGPRCIDRRLVRGGPIPASYARRVLDAYGAHDARLGSL